MRILDVNINELTKIEDKLVVLFGKFDGVHVGHQRLLKKANEIAKENNAKVAIFTFEPHPLVFFNKVVVQELSTSQEKRKLFNDLNVDYYISVKFDEDFANLDKIKFLEIIKDRLNIDTIIAGQDFRFGKNALGNVSDLISFGYNVIVVGDINHTDEVKVGSSLIRKILRSGNVREVNKLLGRNYSVTGTVVSGSQIGRTIGFPTANIDLEESKILPDSGVYIVDIKYQNNTYRGIANIGVNPTVTDKNILKLEVNIFDFNKDIYGEELEVFFLDRIRSEQKFSSLELLKEQLEKDCRIARHFN